MTDPSREAAIARLAAMPAEQLAALRDKVRAQVAEGRREEWTGSMERFCYGALRRHFTSPPSPFHRGVFGLVDSLPQAQGSIHRVEVAPRGQGKSTLLNLGIPAATACQPDVFGLRYGLIGRARYGLAEEDLDAVRMELETNQEILDTYGDIVDRAETRKGRLVTTTGVRWDAVGADQHVRGLRWVTSAGTFRPQLIVLDDLDKDAHSSQFRVGMRAWLQGAMLGLGAPGEPLHVLVGGTAVSTDALVWWLATEAQGWSSSVYSAIEELPDEVSGLWVEWEAIYERDDTPDHRVARAFYDAHREAMDRGARLLWEGEPLYDLMVYRHDAPSAFAAEKQNDPRDAATALLPVGAIRYWGSPGDAYEALPPLSNVQITVDPSKGLADKERDWQAIIGGGVTRSGELVVAEADLVRIPEPSALAVRIVDMAERIGARVIAVEDAHLQTFLRYPIEQEVRRRGLAVAVAGHKHPGGQRSKRQRLLDLEAPLVGGRILLHRRQRELVNQCEALRRDGSSADHDDGPDAMQMLWARVGGLARPSGLRWSPPTNGEARSTTAKLAWTPPTFGDVGAGDRPSDIFPVGGAAGARGAIGEF